MRLLEYVDMGWNLTVNVYTSILSYYMYYAEPPANRA